MKILTALGAVAAVLLIAVFLYWAIPAFGIWGSNVNREITQHSQSYVESKTQLLMGLITDYEDPKATVGQKTAIVNEFCYQVTLLTPEERPAPIVRFQASHC